MSDMILAAGVQVVSHTIESILEGSFAKLGRLLGRVKIEPSPGGEHSERLIAYRRFRRACLDMRSRMQTLQAMPTGAVGLLITLPANLRLLRDLPDLATELSDSALDVGLIGTSPVVHAASETVVALNKATTGAQPARKVRKGGLSAAQRILWKEFDTAVADFVADARADLNLTALEEPAAQSQ